MILLDTNVISALMRPEPNVQVVAWLDAQPQESIWTTSITVFEVRFGLELLATGKRRRTLEEKWSEALTEDLGNRVIVFDQPAATAAAHLAAQRRRAGRPIDFRDIQIAGIAVARRATLATHNLRHFEGLGVDLVDPSAG